MGCCSSTDTNHKYPLSTLSNTKQMMIHGTNKESSEQILKRGFSSSYFKDSSMLGGGVYLTRDLTKANMFGEYIIFCDVDLGKTIEITFQNHPVQKTWHTLGFNSAFVPAGCGMVKREEFCVKDPSRVKPILVVSGDELQLIFDCYQDYIHCRLPDFYAEVVPVCHAELTEHLHTLPVIMCLTILLT